MGGFKDGQLSEMSSLGAFALLDVCTAPYMSDRVVTQRIRERRAGHR